MQTRVPDYFKKFKCIADKCEDTCCAGWGIVVDDEMNKKYSSVTNDFGKVLNSKITIDEDGDRVFVMNGRNCAFLNENKLCDIYGNLGEEYLCYTCQQYPRFTEGFGNIIETGLSLSCPEAARIILNEEKITEFELSEDDEMVSCYNDLSYEMFVNLMRTRKLAIDIAQNRKLDLRTRIGIILCFALDIQDKIDNNKIEEIELVRKEYLKDEYINNLLLEFKEYENNPSKKINTIHRYFEEYIKLDHIDEDYLELLKEKYEYFNLNNINEEEYINIFNEFDEYYKNNTYEYEHLIVYFIYRYFMKAVFDYEVSSKVKMAVVSFLMIKEMDVIRYHKKNKEFTKEDQVEIMHKYSKDIEHSEENMEKLYDKFECNELFEYENIISALIS